MLEESIPGGLNTSLPDTTVMRAVSWVKGPFDVLLEQAFMIPFLIPNTYGSSELPFTSCEISTVI